MQKKHLERLTIDGSFSRGRYGGEPILYGHKGKGVLLHAIVDKIGRWMGFKITPANGVEWRQAQWILKDILRVSKTLKRSILQGDKGYDVEQLRLQLSYKFGMGSAIDRKKNRKNQSGGRPQHRQVVENLFAHLYHRYRRLADCWEKLDITRNAITRAAFIHYWLKKSC